MAGMTEWTHITMFDRTYPLDKQAEGMAVHQAVVEGHCGQCGFLARCSTDAGFKPPVFAWCFRRKADILDKWHEATQKEG